MKHLTILPNLDPTKRAKKAGLDHVMACTRANSDLTLLHRRPIAGEFTLDGVL